MTSSEERKWGSGRRDHGVTTGGSSVSTERVSEEIVTTTIEEETRSGKGVAPSQTTRVETSVVENTFESTRTKTFSARRVRLDSRPKVVTRLAHCLTQKTFLAYRRIAKIYEAWKFQEYKKRKTAFNFLISTVERIRPQLGEAFRALKQTSRSRDERYISRILFLLSKKFKKKIDENFLNEQIRFTILRNNIKNSSILNVISDNDIVIEKGEFGEQTKISKMEKLIKIYSGIELFCPLDIIFYNVQQLYNRSFMISLHQFIVRKRQHKKRCAAERLADFFEKKSQQNSKLAFGKIRGCRPKSTFLLYHLSYLMNSRADRHKMQAFRRLAAGTRDQTALFSMLSHLARARLQAPFFKMLYYTQNRGLSRASSAGGGRSASLQWPRYSLRDPELSVRSDAHRTPPSGASPRPTTIDLFAGKKSELCLRTKTDVFGGKKTDFFAGLRSDSCERQTADLYGGSKTGTFEHKESEVFRERRPERLRGKNFGESLLIEGGQSEKFGREKFEGQNFDLSGRIGVEIFKGERFEGEELGEKRSVGRKIDISEMIMKEKFDLSGGSKGERFDLSSGVKKEKLRENKLRESKFGREKFERERFESEDLGRKRFEGEKFDLSSRFVGEKFDLSGGKKGVSSAEQLPSRPDASPALQNESLQDGSSSDHSELDAEPRNRWLSSKNFSSESVHGAMSSRGPVDQKVPTIRVEAVLPRVRQAASLRDLGASDENLRGFVSRNFSKASDLHVPLKALSSLTLRKQANAFAALKARADQVRQARLRRRVAALRLEQLARARARLLLTHALGCLKSVRPRRDPLAMRAALWKLAETLERPMKDRLAFFFKLFVSRTIVLEIIPVDDLTVQLEQEAGLLISTSMCQNQKSFLRRNSSEIRFASNIEASRAPMISEIFLDRYTNTVAPTIQRLSELRDSQPLSRQKVKSTFLVSKTEQRSAFRSIRLD